MIRRTTWIVLIVLLALVGFSFYLKNHKAQQAASVTPTSPAGGPAAPLFSTSEGTPTDLGIKDTTGRAVDVARNASGVWVLKAPTDAPADQASAEAAATQVTSLRVISNVQLGLDVVGLDKPTYTMSFSFSNGKKHTLTVGALTPIQDGYYASLDQGPVRIVDRQGLEALIQLLNQPPFAATATSAAPTAGTATLEPTRMPTVTDTPAATAPATSPTP
jgi:hypothetical protein